MNYLLRVVALAFFLSIGMPTSAEAFRDLYPKNPKIDVINYVFKLDLSDSTDEILGEATVDVRFLAAGVSELRLDLVNASKDLNGKGMTVSDVTMGGKAASYRHENNALFIKLPVASTANQRSKVSQSCTKEIPQPA